MSNTLKAALWMIGAIVAFSTMAVAGRAVSSQLDTFEIMLYRSITGIVIVVVVIFATGKQHQINRERLGLHFLRNIAHFAGQNLWFYALPLIPLAQLFALEFTSPLWVLALSPLLLGERLTRLRALSALLGFIGILIVARPGAVPIDAGMITGALAAIGFAITIILTKKLTQTTTITCILFYLTGMQALFGLIFAGIDGDIAVPTAANTPWIILIGCAGLMAHFCLTTALSLAPATIVVPIDFARLPAIAIVGMLFYNEPIDAFVLIGALVIFGANYLNIWSENRPKPSLQSTS